MANNPSWGKLRGFFEVDLVFTILHGKSLARCLILLPSLTSVPSLCLPCSSLVCLSPTHQHPPLMLAGCGRGRVLGPFPLPISFPRGRALLLRSWVSGDWHSSPPHPPPGIGPKLSFQTFFPPGLKHPLPSRHTGRLIWEKKGKTIRPRVQNHIKKNSCLYKVCDSFFFFFLTTVSWNDFPDLASFYLPNLFPPPPPVVSTWLSWPFHLARRARDIYVYSELLQLLIFPFILTFIIFCLVFDPFISLYFCSEFLKGKS